MAQQILCLPVLVRKEHHQFNFPKKYHAHKNKYECSCQQISFPSSSTEASLTILHKLLSMVTPFGTIKKEKTKKKTS
uniref:Uncharacterized protein n=1 Tax=Rhizophora mucronata TaxID=61149 RepID=A0A2P2PN51_RHIMU